MAYKSEKLKHNGKNWRIDTCDQLEDLLVHASGPATGWGRGRLSVESCFNGADIQTDSLDEAFGLARFGWPKGRKKLSDNLDAASMVQTNSTHRALGLDVGGAYPDVQEAIAGNPACMVASGLEQSATKPIFRFVVNVALGAMMNGDVMVRRGAAILSWIDRLEAEGARCEVVLFYGQSRERETETDRWNVACTVKRADEPMDVDRLAFALLHPSMTRRIIFAAQEQYKDLQWRGYGMPSDDMHPDLMVKHSVFFRRLLGSEECWRTPAAAVAEVERAIKEATQHTNETPEQEAA